MAKIQVVMAVTLDGFLPHREDPLLRWIKENSRYGFPYWQERNALEIYPHYGIIDLMDMAETDKELVCSVEVSDDKRAEYASGLFRYNLVNEMVIYLLPLTYGQGTGFSWEFHPYRWKLHAVKSFSNGICRLVYRNPDSY